MIDIDRKKEVLREAFSSDAYSPRCKDCFFWGQDNEEPVPVIPGHPELGTVRRCLAYESEEGCCGGKNKFMSFLYTKENYDCHFMNLGMDGGTGFYPNDDGWNNVKAAYLLETGNNANERYELTREDEN